MIRAWRFRVQLHRIYPYAITKLGTYYKYILADEDVSFRLNVTRCTQFRIIEPLNSRLFLDFKSIHEIPRRHWRDLKYPIDTMGVVFNMEAYLDAPSGPRMEFYIRDNIQVIVALKMWRVWKFIRYFGPPEIWLETEGGFADFRFNPRFPEVEEFRQSLLNSDPYVQKYGVEGLV
ncbi:unnamed protein product [Eruca vesicaria subsp. sativa]|uniref:Uncharacterized protein n=1 Tax=Eruca vesicaria subsp. sativa TaxID=29727 RepID=A0ABC8L691_ERUVS|nr:unnamed protein product [Eruca vesicaria subsp. sativa]